VFDKNVFTKFTINDVKKVILELIFLYQKKPDLLSDLLPNTFQIITKYLAPDRKKKGIPKKSVRNQKVIRKHQTINSVSIIDTYLTHEEKLDHVNKIKIILQNLMGQSSISIEQSIDLLRRICKTKYYEEASEKERSIINSLLDHILANSSEKILSQSTPIIFYHIGNQYELSLSRNGQLVSIKKINGLTTACT
jgi:hypothetical protein